MRNLILVIVLSISCASKWQIKDVSVEKRPWRICDEKDSPDKYRKGFCYISQECKKNIFRTKCKPLPLFCAWEDHVCMERYKLFSKKLR